MTRTNNPRIHWGWWLLGIFMLLAWHYWPHDPAPRAVPSVASTPATGRLPEAVATPDQSPAQPLPGLHLPAFLPPEARTTILRIQHGGPFLHRQDGSLFGNREGHLPRQPRGWYHEYTVETPGLSHRGTRRIITGGNPPRVWYYTSDHYGSFRAFDPGTASGAMR